MIFREFSRYYKYNYLIIFATMKSSVHTFRGEEFEMDYAVFGEGSVPMVILPGMSLLPVTPNAQSVACAFKQFHKACTIYLFDRRKSFPQGFSVFDMAADTVKALESLGIRNAFVYGASQGAMTAMVLAARHPHLVGRLALASTSARQGDVCRENMRTWAEFADASDTVALNRDFFSKVYSPGFVLKHRDALAAMETLGTAEQLRNFGISARATASFDFLDEVSSIKCPVFLSGVRQDTVLGGQGTLDIARELGCEPWLYDGPGHAVFDEDPLFIPRLASFFGIV